MIKANIEAKIKQLYQDLDTEKKDSQRIDNLIKGLESQKRIVKMQIKDLEYKIQQLEEELNNEC